MPQLDCIHFCEYARNESRVIHFSTGSSLPGIDLSEELLVFFGAEAPDPPCVFIKNAKLQRLVPEGLDAAASG